MRARRPVRSDHGPYTILDLHELPEDGKGVELEDGWLIEVAVGSRHNWAAQNLGLILHNAAADAKAPVVLCYGGERTGRVRKVTEYARLRIPQQTLSLGADGYFPRPPVRQGTRFTAEIDPDNPFTMSFDPAELLDL